MVQGSIQHTVCVFQKVSRAGKKVEMGRTGSPMLYWNRKEAELCGVDQRLGPWEGRSQISLGDDRG